MPSELEPEPPDGPGRAPALEAADVSRRFGRQWAVRRVSVAFLPGTISALVGHNGSGKSTLLALLAGALRPTEGEILAFGTDLHHHPEPALVRQRVAWLAHQPPVYPDLTGPENLALAAGLYGRHLTAEHQAAVLDRVGLHGARRQRVRAYSRGMVQRLGLARTIIQGASVWLLDEPMTGLDRAGRDLFVEVIAEARGRDIALIVVTHHVDVLGGIVDVVHTLERGRLVAAQAGAP